MATNAKSPVPTTELEKIAQDACEQTLGTTETYIHAHTESWNSNIIRKILESLIAHSRLTSTTTTTSADSSTPTPPKPQPQYKYAVNSTIIQHLTDPHPSQPPTTTTATSKTHPTPTDPPPTSTTSSTQTTTDSKGEQTVSPPTTPTHGSSGTGGSAENGAATRPESGRRGMHCATGAYWNNETDGIWNFKWEGGGRRGMDVVVCVFWIAM